MEERFDDMYVVHGHEWRNSRQMKYSTTQPSRQMGDCEVGCIVSGYPGTKAHVSRTTRPIQDTELCYIPDIVLGLLVWLNNAF